jgi:hypothetical protein
VKKESILHVYELPQYERRSNDLRGSSHERWLKKGRIQPLQHSVVTTSIDGTLLILRSRRYFIELSRSIVSSTRQTLAATTLRHFQLVRWRFKANLLRNFAKNYRFEFEHVTWNLPAKWFFCASTFRYDVNFNFNLQLSQIFRRTVYAWPFDVSASKAQTFANTYVQAYSHNDPYALHRL